MKLAEENARSVIPDGSRKINGKYIQSHLLSRLEGNSVKHDILLFYYKSPVSPAAFFPQFDKLRKFYAKAS